MSWLALLLAAAVSAEAAPAPAKARTMDRPSQRVVNASFECRAPASWTAEKRPDGVLFTGPAELGVPTRVIVRYVAPGHALYPDPEAYMARLSKPSSVPLPGWKTGPVREGRVAGRKALHVEKETVEFADPKSIEPKEVPMLEEHVAIPAAEGFYLLIYSAPRRLDAAQRPAFRKLLESFKPKL